jgi:proton-translocating NADH-quinone oxidoreductase chain M
LHFISVLLFFINPQNLSLLRLVALTTCSFVHILSSLILASFNTNIFIFQNVISFNLGSSYLNLLYSFGFDGISIFLYYLSSLLIFLCVIFVWNDKFFKEYAINLLIIDLFLLIIFSVLDLFFFYVFFEAILIPMYLIIGVWGSRERKIRAVYLFFFYTLGGSILMLLGILYIFAKMGTLNMEILMTKAFSFNDQIFLWCFFFLSFSSKIPMYPFHIWLPEAHVEAPTVGSVLLAGILLKLGVYGFLRFNLTLFPEASLYFSPIVYLLSLIGIIYASLNAIRQTDLKRIIAYSSIAHMNLVVLGIFSFNLLGIEGALLQSISHGFVSGGMFFLIGIIYDRYHSRFLYYYGGLVHMMPLYSVLFLIFTMANIALPGTSSFVGEFLLLCGIFKINFFTSIISALSVILCGTYSLWLYNRIVFGNLKIEYLVFFEDITFREFTIILPLFFLIFLMGMYPSFFIDFLDLTVSSFYFVII